MFQPVVPLPGLAGWRFLQRTYDAQSAAFAASTQNQRDVTYFRETIGSVQSAQDLVSDRQLLSVALGAFGLQDDIDNRFFIQKVLEEGTASDDTLANRLSDSRYRAISDAFGFGPDVSPNTAGTEFAQTIITQFEANGFEVATGAQDPALRIALYTERTLPDLAADDRSTDAKWFTILGDPPLREVFEKALNLPQSIGQIDIDQQLGIFKDRAISVFGSEEVDQFANDANIENLITKFVARDQINALGSGLSSNSIALTLLQT